MIRISKTSHPLKASHRKSLSLSIRTIRSVIVLSLGMLLTQAPVLEGGEHGAEAAPTETHATVDAHKAEETHKSVKNKASPKVSLVSEAAFEDYQKAKEEVAAKQKELSAKEIELNVREKAITSELKKLEEARLSIEQTQQTQKQESQAKVNKLVETVLSMNPKAAAKLIASVNDELAVAVMTRIETSKLSKILNVMEVDRASKLSELMTGVQKVRKPAHRVEKGGDKNDHKDELKSERPASIKAEEPAVGQPGAASTPNAKSN